MLTVLFFGQLKEVLKTERLTIENNQALQSINNVADLRGYLQTKGDLWQEYLALGKTLVAVNQEISGEQTLIESGAEVAFFPPVTGG